MLQDGSIFFGGLQMETPTTLLTDDEFGQLTKTSRTLRWRWRRSGKLGYCLIGGRIRYTQRHLEEFIARTERKAKSLDERGH